MSAYDEEREDYAALADEMKGGSMYEIVMSNGDRAECETKIDCFKAAVTMHVDSMSNSERKRGSLVFDVILPDRTKNHVMRERLNQWLLKRERRAS